MSLRLPSRSASGLCALVLATVSPALLAAGCGDEDAPATAGGNRTDAAFVAAMVPHHESAIAMARAVRHRGEHAQIRRLARDIMRTQREEIALMHRVRGDLDHADGRGHMGMSDHAMGTDGDMPMLRSARPVDRAFIDMMIPHHAGAVRMARREIATGEEPRLRRLAREIVTAQTREIERMRAWRTRWYGGAGARHRCCSMMDGHRR